jgi:uncharacterized protein YjbI with pentapeptide repeats
MQLWVIWLIGALILIVAVAPGMYLWWPTRGDLAARSDFGVNLVTGALVALAIFVLQLLFELRIDTLDTQRQAQANRQNLELTIGLQHNLTGIDLTGKPLGHFYFYGKTLRDAQFRGADLTGAILTRSDLSCADLSGAILNDTTAGEIVIEGVNLEAARLVDATLDYSHRSKQGCNDDIQHHPDFDGAVLIRATLTHARLHETSFRNTNFGGASLSDAVLSGSDLTGARLVHASLDRADISDSDLTRASFVDASLAEADLHKATLRHTKFMGANLAGTDLRGTDLRDANLSGAEYDSHTRWPAHYKQRRCPKAQARVCHVAKQG